MTFETRINRRKLLVGGLAVGGSMALAACETGSGSVDVSGNFVPAEKWKPQVVNYSDKYGKGVIVVDPKNYYLYWTLGGGKARRYGVATGEGSKGFTGRAKISRKSKWPSWTPTQAMLARAPDKYGPYRNGVPGGPKNPMGSRALYLYRGGRDTLYRIHGTNDPRSIGSSRSQGCIRMINGHINDLYDRVPLNTRVIVL